ncbi:riboflavin synthase [Pelagibacteraceae bacterium]|nr:riboflavin synthase [Pelagibacteraceae bacterium]
MFNGIIYNTGIIKLIKKNNNSLLIGIQSNLNFKNKDIGSSVSCDGVCLTIESIKKNIVFFYISRETLLRSNLKFIKKGDVLNLEKSLVYGQKISGHFAQGHVDTIASISKIRFYDNSWLIEFSIKNKSLSKFLVEKASITINGVSLTISKINKHSFETSVIPHTLKLTNLSKLKINKIVNIELDIFAKYIEKISN